MPALVSTDLTSPLSRSKRRAAEHLAGLRRPLLVSLSGVGVRFGATPVLTDVSLEVRSGRSVGLVGANGSGKTTLLRVMAALLRPTEGSGLVLAARLGSNQISKVRSLIGLIGHEPAVYDELTLRENLKFCGQFVRATADQIDEALHYVGLKELADRRAVHASNGMRRRLDFARIRITQPHLLLLDEPHAGLDMSARELIADAVADVKQRGGASIVATHRLDDLLSLVDAVCELDAGSLAPMVKVAI